MLSKKNEMLGFLPSSLPTLMSLWTFSTRILWTDLDGGLCASQNWKHFFSRSEKHNNIVCLFHIVNWLSSLGRSFLNTLPSPTLLLSQSLLLLFQHEKTDQNTFSNMLPPLVLEELLPLYMRFIQYLLCQRNQVPFGFENFGLESYCNYWYPKCMCH